ncbi:Glycosyltransferase involved in cell wall bisynthesis [Rhodovulum sp. ES.010]|uniref:exopolysaccharide biosynthesis GT4 family glycosyltransferase EpsE n=1 Tax=Rhodovulum sp. ES.010 TaxID=1882821 RepID=UPI0009280229|nr:exopolysaccharide biosynthesis GT4 family glycosyltransferase EpsE [Rhodovulum sp. ES.010]SIO59726.1 Glycosyltransferase involved in cell wall bisynthesis [Rhodovulum sp. ES.010]
MGETARIGVIVPEFPGQTHTFFWREMQAMDRLGVDLSLISTRRPAARLVSHDWAGEAIARTTYLAPLGPGPLAASLPAAALALRDGIGARAIAAERAWFLRSAALHVPFARHLNRLARARGFGHVHVHSCGRSALIAMLARRMGGPSYSLTLHGPLCDYGPGQRYKWRDAAFATVVTETLKREVERTVAGIGLPPILVQPMGVDTDRFRRDAPYVPADPKAPVRIFSCGRLNRVKGHDHLIRAVGRLAQQGVDARLEIAGEDDAGGTGYRKTLETQIAEEGLGDRVTLLGAIGQGALRDRLLAAHLFVLASRREALGVAYMEAMACELPVVGTNAGGVPELIDHGRNGVLVPPEDVDALVAAISGLLADPDRARAMGRAGRRTVVDRFAAARSAQTLVDAIAAHGAPPPR